MSLTQFSINNGASYTSVNVVGELTRTIVSNNGGTNLTDVIIGTNVTSIGIEAFLLCTNLKNISIPNSVITIKDYAFRECTTITNIVIPNSVTSIGDYSFQACFSLLNITIGSSVTSIGAIAFQQCFSLTNIVIPDSVTNIGDNAFISCNSLLNVTFGRGLSNIGNQLFSSNTLHSITFNGLPSTITTVGANIFTTITPNNTRTVTFTNISNENQINVSLLNQVKNIVANTSVTTTGPQIFISSITPTVINVPSIISKTYGNIPFNIDASSNSPASFNYSSSDTSVTTVNSSGLVTLISNGTAIITTSQNAVPGYTSASANTTINVNSNTYTNPVIINNINELLYFMNTSSIYANIVNNLEINDDLIATSYKVLTGNNITITKSNN